MQTSEDHTLTTLRMLKQNGSLRGTNPNGQPVELDPEIASELLAGTAAKPAIGNSNKLTANPLEIQRQHSPLPGLPKEQQSVGRTPSAGSIEASAPVRVSGTDNTEDLLRRLVSECEAFNENLVANFNTVKENMQKDFLELFKSTTREKLPDSFLRSLPKWGKGAAKLHHVFNKSVQKRGKADPSFTGTGAGEKEASFELVIQPEVLQEIDDDIRRVIAEELQQCVGEDGVVVNDMRRILYQVTVVMEKLRELEAKMNKDEAESRALQGRLQDERLLSQELTAKIENLTAEGREKEIQMDILREQVQRERETARQKRADFFKEICRYKTQIHHFTTASTEERDRDHPPRSPRDKSLRRESSIDASAVGNDQSVDYYTVDPLEIQQAVEAREAELRSEFQEQMRVMRAQHAEQVKQLQQQKKVACDEREEQNASLMKRIKKLEFELVEEKRKLRRFMSSLEKEGDEGRED